MEDAAPATPDEVIQRNIELGHALAIAMSSADVIGITATLDPDVVWHFPGYDHSLAGDHIGYNGVTHFAHTAFQLTAGTFHMDLHDVFGSREGAVISFTGHGTRPDGRTLNNPSRLELRISGGRAQELWEFVWDSSAVADFWR